MTVVPQRKCSCTYSYTLTCSLLDFHEAFVRRDHDVTCQRQAITMRKMKVSKREHRISRRFHFLALIPIGSGCGRCGPAFVEGFSSSVQKGVSASRKQVPSLLPAEFAGSQGVRVDTSISLSSTSYSSTTDSQSAAPSVPSSSSSLAAQWHRQRRQAMMQSYRAQIAPLEQTSSLSVGLPLLFLANSILLTLSLAAGKLSLPWVFILAIFPGSVCSLWQLQILHDVLHGCFQELSTKKSANSWSHVLLFIGSMPSFFGYYLYLKFGHLTHHKNVGNPSIGNLKTLFESPQRDFEDGDVLFVAHRMKLPPNKIGPTFALPGNRTLTASLSRSAFDFWRPNQPLRNGIIFAASFWLERFMLMINDVVVSITGRNYFFPNKPESFHRQCALYARCATLVRCLIWVGSGCSYKSLLFLFLSETLWSLPPHPAAAMFVTNHPSASASSDSPVASLSGCAPTQSTYAGQWYSFLTLGTNYHCEHHDFPTIPFHQLYRLKQIAPEFYPISNQSLWTIMRQTLAQPTAYACMNLLEGAD